MDIILFLAGFLTGAILVAVIFTVVNSKGKNSTDALMKQMELYFENTANKIFEESSAKFSNTNKEKLDDFFSNLKKRLRILKNEQTKNLKMKMKTL